MQCNVGKKDRILRFVLGFAIILLGIYFKSWWGAVGLILILTGAMRWCPAYIPFGLSTCKEEKK